MEENKQPQQESVFVFTLKVIALLFAACSLIFVFSI